MDKVVWIEQNEYTEMTRDQVEELVNEYRNAEEGRGKDILKEKLQDVRAHAIEALDWDIVALIPKEMVE